AREAQLEMAKLYVKKLNQPDQGVTLYREVISSEPKSQEAANAHYELGMHHFRSKDYKSAQEQFDTVVNSFAELELSNSAQLMLAKSFEEAKDYKQAAEIYDNFANRHPTSNRAALALVNKARIQKNNLKDQQEAKRTYQSIVKKYGRLEGVEDQISEAKKELTEIGASIPKPDDPSSTKVGRAIERQNNRREMNRPRGGVEKSRAMGTTAQIPDSGFGISAQEVMRNFGGQRGVQADQDGTYYDAELMIAEFLYGDEYYRDAGALLFDAIHRAKADNAKIDPYSYVRLSVCYRKLGMHKRAKEMLREAVKRDRRVLDAVITTGQNHYSDAKIMDSEDDRRESYEKAIAVYNSVLGFNQSKDAEVYFRLGLAYQKMGNLDMERESFERAVAVKPDFMDALQWLPDVYKRMKNRTRAVTFQNIVVGKGDIYENKMAIADVCYKYESYGRAKSNYSAALRNAKRGGKVDINMDSVDRLTNLPGIGSTLANAIVAGRPYEGVDDLLRVEGINEQRLEPIRERIAVQRAVVREEKRKREKRIVYSTIRTAMAALKLGQEDQAKELMDELVAGFPDHPLVPYGQGEIALIKGDTGTAIESFKKAIEKAPHSDFAPVALGEYYLSQGYDDEALAVWETYVEGNRYNKNINQRLKQLRSRIGSTDSSAELE
ncbi:MAG: tetratricopeptide repeat protein, partial [Candidatus Poribacteria bacterium]|nr:tetratricopeptide repeat protein [Candidatus Poribacteria bacterium]